MVVVVVVAVVVAGSTGGWLLRLAVYRCWPCERGASSPRRTHPWVLEDWRFWLGRAAEAVACLYSFLCPVGMAVLPEPPMAATSGVWTLHASGLKLRVHRGGGVCRGGRCGVGLAWRAPADWVNRRMQATFQAKHPGRQSPALLAVLQRP